MKIAVASDDRVTIANHFGRTAGFLVFETQDGKVVSKEYIINHFTGHAAGHHHHEGDEPGGHHHSHDTIISALRGCDVVIARGMGRRMLDDFEITGKQVFITHLEDATGAVEQFLKGTLRHDAEKSCQH